MTRFKDIREIPIGELEIGIAQVRLRDVGKEIDELADSIAKVGLLEPIVVCETDTGKYEIITGQRRFLAHQKLGKPSVLAAILNERVDETTAKVISVTENLVRRDLNSRDLIDVCTELYRKYGSVSAVVAETGLPRNKVAQYVKYERLQEDLKELVDQSDVTLTAALRAQDAAERLGDVTSDELVEMAREMTGMSGAQQSRVVEELTDGGSSVSGAIENAKSGGKVTQIVVTLTARVHGSLKQAASDDESTMDTAAGRLIEEALTHRGLLDE